VNANERRHVRVDAATRFWLEAHGRGWTADAVVAQLERAVRRIDDEFADELRASPIARYVVPVIGGIAHFDTDAAAKRRALEPDARGYFYAQHADGSFGDDVHVSREEVAA
jgi:hypothetical protein